MSDPLEHADICGVTSTNRFERVRWRAGAECGDELFEDGVEFDGLTLTIEVAGKEDALAMIEAISKQS